MPSEGPDLVCHLKISFDSNHSKDFMSFLTIQMRFFGTWKCKMKLFEQFSSKIIKISKVDVS